MGSRRERLPSETKKGTRRKRKKYQNGRLDIIEKDFFFSLSLLVLFSFCSLGGNQEIERGKNVLNKYIQCIYYICILSLLPKPPVTGRTRQSPTSDYTHTTPVTRDYQHTHTHTHVSTTSGVRNDHHHHHHYIYIRILQPKTILALWLNCWEILNKKELFFFFLNNKKQVVVFPIDRKKTIFFAQFYFSVHENNLAAERERGMGHQTKNMSLEFRFDLVS